MTYNVFSGTLNPTQSIRWNAMDQSAVDAPSNAFKQILVTWAAPAGGSCPPVP